MNKIIVHSLLRGMAFFDGSNAGWKKDENGALVVDVNGNPIYVQTDGAESAVNFSTIATLNREAQTNRERAERAEASLKPFEGLDVKKARDAISAIANIDQDKLIASEKLEQVRAEITADFQNKINEKDELIVQHNSRISDMILGAEFTSSKFIADKLAIPADVVRSHFGKHFTVDADGKISAKSATGAELYDPVNPGIPATFDQAIEQIVNAYSSRDGILKGSNQSGAGNGGMANDGGAGGSQTYKMADFEKMSPVKQAQISGLVRDGKAKLE